MIRRKKIFCAVIAVMFLTGTYTGLWIYSAGWFNKEIDNLYANAQEEGIEFLGAKPRLTNFPFVPQVIYHGGFKAGSIEILFPQMILRGYPVPFTDLHLDFPLGLSAGGAVDPRIWTLDRLEAKLEIPYHLPRAMTQEELHLWQSRGGKIDVKEYSLKKESLLSKGSGLLALDDALQPVFAFDSRITGYEDFIRSQQEKRLIEPLPAAIAIGVLGGLAETDEATKQQTVRIQAGLRNRLLTVGPLQVLELPAIAWDTHTPPAPRQ